MSIALEIERFDRALTRLTTHNGAQYAPVSGFSQGEHVESKETTNNPSMEKFLDRMAEMFACNGPGVASGHVSATVLVRTEGNVPKVYVAKNGGPSNKNDGLSNKNGGSTNKDGDMAKHMQFFLRACAQSSSTSDARNGFWGWLLEYNKRRIAQYITDITKLSVSEYSSLYADADAVLLAKKLVEYSASSSDVLAKHDRVSKVAYKLRYKRLKASLTMTIPQKKAVSATQFLGLYKAAYLTFQNVARRDSSFQNITITFLKGKTYRVPGHTTDFYCHAEIQLLGFLETDLPPDEHPYPYFGCSKKACWACYHFLDNYATKIGPKYDVRGCHGRAFDHWHLGVLAEREQCRLRVVGCLDKVIRLAEEALGDGNVYESMDMETPDVTPLTSPRGRAGGVGMRLPVGGAAAAYVEKSFDDMNTRRCGWERLVQFVEYGFTCFFTC
jgi:hypothetical protein